MKKKIGAAARVAAKAKDSATKVGMELSKPAEAAVLPSGKTWMKMMSMAAIKRTKSKTG